MNWIDFNKIIESQMRPSSRPKHQIYVSDIGNCLRKSYYSYFQPTSHSPETLKRFLIGNMIHDKITHFLASNFSVKSEKDVAIYIESADISIRGRYDDLVTVNGEKILVEKKSTSRIELVKEPTFSNNIQTHLYMGALGVKKAQIVYFNKNNMNIKDFRIDFSKTVFDMAINRVKTLVKHIRVKELPDPESRFNPSVSWQCRYCSYKSDCDSNKNIT